MSIRRSERLRGPISAQLRAALYYARKRRLARLQGGSEPVVTPQWRILCIDGQNTSFFGIAEIQMRSSIGGADQSTTGQTIFGTERLNFEATLAFDDSPSTEWSADRTEPADTLWLGQDFGSSTDIVEVVLTARNDGFENQCPQQFDVQSSPDGVTWTTVWSVTGEPAWASGETRVFTKP